MQVDEAIRARRAIKWYDPEHQMPEETFLKLMEHAILTPTGAFQKSRTTHWPRKLTTKIDHSIGSSGLPYNKIVA